MGNRYHEERTATGEMTCLESKQDLGRREVLLYCGYCENSNPVSKESLIFVYTNTVEILKSHCPIKIF